MFLQFVSLLQYKYVLCISVLNITYTEEPDVQSPPKDVVKDTVLKESQFFLPGFGLTEKIYFDRYVSNIARVCNFIACETGRASLCTRIVVEVCFACALAVEIELPINSQLLNKAIQT